MGAGTGSPNGARIFHHGTDEPLKKQNSVPDGKITLPTQERTQHTDILINLLPDLIDVR